MLSDFKIEFGVNIECVKFSACMVGGISVYRIFLVSFQYAWGMFKCCVVLKVKLVSIVSQQ